MKRMPSVESRVRSGEYAGAVVSGFTLIEIVISAGLMSLILVSGYLCLNAAVSSQKMIEPRVEIIQSARVAMALITADLRSACPLSKDYDLLGMHRMLGDAHADNLDFATHNYTPRRAGEGDFCEMSFFAEQDPQSAQLTLWRRRNPRIGLDPLSGGSREEIARGVLGLRFEYYDGYEWYDSWGDVERRGKAQTSRRERYNLEGLPEAIRITLWFDSNPRAKKTESREESASEPPLAFQTVARLNLAAAPQRGSQNGASPASTDRAGQILPGSGGEGRNP